MESCVCSLALNASLSQGDCGRVTVRSQVEADVAQATACEGLTDKTHKANNDLLTLRKGKQHGGIQKGRVKSN